MPICLVEEELEYQADDTVFRYQRLLYDDRDKITYLSVQRGQLDQRLYDKICVAVALRGWENLAGIGGLIPWPYLRETPESATLTAEQVAGLVLLFPGLTPLLRAQLWGTLYVVEHLPLSVMLELVQRVNELSPESVKKKLAATVDRRLRFTNRRTGHEFTCGDCRAQYADEQRRPPCDTGGLSACPYWQTHEASPGEPMSAGERLAFELYPALHAGNRWDTLLSLRTLTLTRADAEALWVRLTWLHDHLSALHGQMPSDGQRTPHAADYHFD